MIEVKDLSFWYKKNYPIFRGMSLKMENGVCGLLGENGVGKSSLLRIVAGLRFPNSGTCQIDGVDTMYRCPDTLSKLFFLPEEFEAPEMKVSEFIKRNAVFYPRFSKEQFDAYTQRFELDTDRKISDMSFGQKKKLMISYGLALNTPYLLLDEPTNGLDIPSKGQFRRVVAEAMDGERCIVISTHQVRDLENLIDPVVILDRHQVLVNNSLAEISQKLLFRTFATPPADALYVESSPVTSSYVARNTSGEETTVNLEMLFNAAISNKRLFKELFNV